MNNEDLKNAVKDTHFADFGLRVVNENDEIEFECQRCGGCCTHRDGRDAVLISPLDIYNGAKALGITAKEFVDEYCESYVGNQSGLIVMVLACNEFHTCKLLEQKLDEPARCKIHKAKPIICALHPLGIVHQYDKTSKQKDFGYVMVDQCPQSCTGKKIKVSDIVNNLPGTREEIDAASEVRTVSPKKGMVYVTNLIKLHSMLVTAKLSDEQIKECGITERIMDVAKKIESAYTESFGECKLEEHDDFKFDKMLTTEAHALASLYDTNMVKSYLDYDTNKPFLEQCRDNIKDFREFIGMYEGLGDLVEFELTRNIEEEKKEEFTTFVNNFDGYVMRLVK